MKTTETIAAAGGYRKTSPWQEAFDSACFLESDMEILLRTNPSPEIAAALEMSRRIIMVLRQENVKGN